MHSKKTSVLSAQIKMTSTVIFWGGSFIATKLAVAEVSPVVVVWLRFLVGVLIIGWIARQRGELGIPSPQDGLELLGLGFLGITLHQWLQSSGLVTSEAATTAWIIATTPVFMALLGWLFLKERLGLGVIVGFIAATLGVLLVVTKGDFSSLLTDGFGKPGDILILFSALNWAVFSALSSPILKRLSAIKVTFYVLLFGWLLTSIQFFASAGWHEFSQITLTGWLSIAFLGIFCSALAYIFYYDGLQALPASHVGAFLYLEPLVATLVAVAILSENITPLSLAGGGFILLGVWLVNRDSARQSP